LNLDQFWWSGASKFYDKAFIKSRLDSAKTKAYFMFGYKETSDIYGLETKYHYSEKYFGDLPNVKVRYVDKNHVWFGDEISKILSGK
jgi:hypothetical protein